jgi:hypothetical protein
MLISLNKLGIDYILIEKVTKVRGKFEKFVYSSKALELRKNVKRFIEYENKSFMLLKTHEYTDS